MSRRNSAKAILFVAVLGSLLACSDDPNAAAKWQAIGQALQGAGAAMNEAQAPAAYTPAISSSGLTCMKSGEAVSGMNKICYYNCLGSAAAITKEAVSLCPLCIQR